MGLNITFGFAFTFFCLRNCRDVGFYIELSTVGGTLLFRASGLKHRHDYTSNQPITSFCVLESLDLLGHNRCDGAILTMPDSQRQRPGAKLVTTKDKKKRKSDDDLDIPSKREKQFARIADLEEQLANLGSSNDDQACKCRAHLCEILSDILVASPSLALETDCFGRLWKNCFYNPIDAWRARVAREKRKQRPSLKQTVAGYKSFISESIRLYDYFVHQYLSKLVPPSSQDRVTSTSQQSAQGSFTQDSSLGSTLTVASKQESLDGVVPGLYRLYIYLGDLHRYDEAYNKAEKFYTNAAKLAPGRGNPYNQLAVVAFAKEAHCVALYWYARSLLATHEKFTTSSSNLVRLFGTNREYLREHSRDSKPTVLVQNISKKSSNDSSMVRAQKAAASKSCLAHFVDFHYDLYQQNETKVSPEDEAIMHSKMHAIIASLDSLLQVSGLSDGLLAKIVVINTFSLERARTESQNDVCRRLCKEFLFRLGSTLSERVQTLLCKSLEKASPSKPAPAIRLLLPLEILVEFVEASMEVDANSDMQSYETAHDDFWRNVATVGSLVQKIVDGYKVERHSVVMTQDSRPPYVLKEYELLRGYRPFSVLDQEYDSEDGFLDPDSAIDALELSPSSATQESGTSTGGNSVEENKSKLLRMLDICKRFSLSSSHAPIAVNEDGMYIFQLVSDCGNEEMMDVGSGENGPEDDCMASGPFESSIEDDAGDVVLYQVNVSGNGPALLVPDSVVAGKAAPENNASSESTVVGVPSFESKQPTKKSEAEIVNKKCPQPPAGGTDSETTVIKGPSSFPQGIKPPPGFAAEALIAPPMNEQIPAPLIPHMDVSRVNMESFASPSPYTTSILGQVIQGRAASQAENIFDVPQFSSGWLPPNNPVDDNVYGVSAGTGDHHHYLFGSSKAGTYSGITVGESIELFGDPTLFQSTANPFATQNFRFNTASTVLNTTSSSSSSMYEHRGSITEGAQFLGAAFLNSLVMDEGKTDNPWATK